MKLTHNGEVMLVIARPIARQSVRPSVYFNILPYMYLIKEFIFLTKFGMERFALNVAIEFRLVFVHSSSYFTSVSN